MDIPQIEKAIEVMILIETYWNVNSFRLTLRRTFRFHINRDILECKSGCDVS